MKFFIDNRAFIFIVIVTILISFHFFWLQFSIHVTYPAVLLGYEPDQTFENLLAVKGTFADLLSGHAALLAFIWFIYGVSIQKKEFDIIAKEHHAQSKIYDKQNQILTSQWIEQWISNLTQNFKNQKLEEKTFKLITLDLKPITLNSFQEQLNSIIEHKHIISNAASEKLILRFLLEIQKIENTVQAKITDKDFNDLFTFRLDNELFHVKEQLKSTLLIYIGSQIILRNINPATKLNSRFSEFEVMLKEKYFHSNQRDVLITKYKILIDDLANKKIKLDDYPFNTL